MILAGIMDEKLYITANILKAGQFRERKGVESGQDRTG